MNSTCMLCHGTSLDLMIEVKGITIAHKLLSHADQPHDTFDLRHVVCHDCGLIQIANPIDPDVLYSSFNYNFSEWKHEPHIEHELDTIFAHGVPGSAFEIGCNDGKFLQALHERGVESPFGVEPNPAPFSHANDRPGLNVFNAMISPDIAREALAQNGKFDFVLSRQVLEHVDDLDIFFECVDMLLADDGLLFIDLPDFGRALTLGDVSMLWEEHISNFTEPAVKELLIRKGFVPFEVHLYDFSGGTLSMLSRRQWTSGKDEARTPLADHLALVDDYATRVDAYGERLRRALSGAKNKGYAMALYGAGGRGNVAVTAHRLGEFIDFAIDDQVERLGKFLPGGCIEIRPTEELATDERPIVILLAVNNESEPAVMKRAQDVTNRPLLFLSIFGPDDIHKELDTFEQTSGIR